MEASRAAAIAAIAALPRQLRALVGSLTRQQLTTPFLAHEWTVAQNVHHLADSHMNSYIRIKLMLAEDHPTLRPYDQDVWAMMDDATSADLSYSLGLLDGLHARWVRLFESLPEQAWARTGFHPENGTVTVEGLLHAYANHGRGHLDQISRTLAAENAS